MKHKNLASLALATLLMAAAPPGQLPQRPAERPPSLFGKFIAGVKNLNPFARPARAAAQGAQMPPRTQVSRESLPGERNAVRRDENVRPASAVEPVAQPVPPTRAVAKPRGQRTSRTVSEYMAEEKP